MIVLEMDENTRFKGTDKWPLLFAIADVFRRFSSPKKPLSVDGISEILMKEYGIEKIDRHAVRDYRDRLEEYFSYNFVQVKKKGYYLESIDYALGNDDLLAIAIMIQSSLSFSKESKGLMLENLAHYSSSKRIQRMIESISSIETIGSNPNATEKTTRMLLGILSCIRKATTLVLSVPGRPNAKRTVPGLYPQCVFVKNNEFYLLAERYLKKPDYFLSYTHIYKIKNLIGIKIWDDDKTDPYQSEENRITIYPYKKEPKTYGLNEYISMLGDTKKEVINWGKTERVETAKLEIRGHGYDDLMSTVSFYQEKYGECFFLKKVIEEDRNGSKVARKALATLTLPKEELVSALFANSRDTTLLGPQNVIRSYRTHLLHELRAYEAPEKSQEELS